MVSGGVELRLLVIGRLLSSPLATWLFVVSFDSTIPSQIKKMVGPWAACTELEQSRKIDYEIHSSIITMEFLS
jgi:hypothetical protein